MSMNKIKILHITTHIGGGIGTVLLNYIKESEQNKKFIHKIIAMGYTETRAKKKLNSIKTQYLDNMAGKHKQILNEIAKSDIVLIHWWNHPLLADFLVREILPPSRMVIWCHISGHQAPNNLTSKLLKYPDMFVFASPQSYEIKEVMDLSSEYQKRLRNIWSTGGVDRIKSVDLKKHDKFNIGYVGTVDYVKMHPDFLDMSEEAHIPDVHFTIVGGPNKLQMEQEVKKRKIADKFTFTGFLTEEEVLECLSAFDVFGYPLAPHHYGSCDQVLQEAMAMGVPPVVLDNPMEKYIVEDGITGIVAKNKKEYTRALEELRKDDKLRNTLSQKAKERAFERFSLQKEIKDWEKVFAEILAIPKTVKKWELDKKLNLIKPKDVFIESLGDHARPFTSFCEAKNKLEKNTAAEKIRALAEFTNWQSETKGTVHNFNNFLPGDKYLSEWSKIMKWLK
jgi:L-malate glycosyltransferase